MSKIRGKRNLQLDNKKKSSYKFIQFFIKIGKIFYILVYIFVQPNL